MAKQKQERVIARVYNPTQKTRTQLRVNAYGIVWVLSRITQDGKRLGQVVGHGDYIHAPVPAIDNRTIFRIEDYPKEVAKKKTAKKVEAEIVEG